MKREYLEENVYDAFLNRMKLIFEEFDNIFISFSGGKDSGLLLNLVLDYRNKYYPEKKLGVFHQDFEAQYTVTTEYIERTFERIKDQVEPYWVCLPMATRTAVSSYEMFWYPWDDKKEESWVRPMPDKEYVINLENNPITTYRYRMHQDIYEREHGMMPVSVIDKPLDQRMASTIRHNRARGTHDVNLMSNIVKELQELGRSDAWICKHLGMDKDEVLRLKQITGLATLFKDVNFGQAWRPEEEEEGMEDRGAEEEELW